MKTSYALPSTIVIFLKRSLCYSGAHLSNSLLINIRATRFFANEAADPRGSAVELANHRAVREYRRKISSQRKGLFLTIFGCK